MDTENVVTPVGAPHATQPSNEREGDGLLGAAAGKRWDAEAGAETLNAATWSAGQYAGLSHHHTTLPPTKSTPSLRKDFKLVGLCFPPKGGFYRVVVDRGVSKGQD